MEEGSSGVPVQLARLWVRTLENKKYRRVAMVDNLDRLRVQMLVRVLDSLLLRRLALLESLW